MKKTSSLTRRFLVIMLVFTFILSLTVPAQAAKKPNLEVQEAPIPEGKAGRKLKVDFSLRNTSNYIAKNVNIKPLVDKDSPFIINELNTKKRVDYITPRKQHTFNYTLEIKKEARAGIYPLKFEVKYSNTDGEVITSEETLYIKLSTEHIPTELVVNEVSYDKAKAIAGQSFDAKIIMQNQGTLAAKNIYVEVGASENFTVVNNKYSVFESIIRGFTKKAFTYQLIPSKGLKTGNYPLKVTMKYTNGFGEQVTKTSTVYVAVTGAESQGEASLKIEGLQAPTAASVGANFDISFTLKNAGTNKAKAINVTVSADDNGLVPISLNKEIIASLEPGAAKKMKFTFRGLDDLKTKNYPIRIQVEYGEEKKVKLEQFAGVLINNNKKSSGSETVPVMIIDAYESNPQIVKAGQNFALKLKVWNTNNEKAVKNMKVTLSVNDKSDKNENDVFSPVKGSNTFYVPVLKPGQKMDKEINFFVVPDAKAKTYKINAKFEYEYDQEGKVTKGEGQDIIGIPVVQPSKLQVADIPKIQNAKVGKETDLDITFFNTGKVLISNLLIKVEGDFDIIKGSGYVGKLDIGAQEYFTATIKPTKEGKAKGKVTITYEDTSGKAQTVEKELEIETAGGLGGESGAVSNGTFDGTASGGDLTIDENYTFDGGEVGGPLSSITSILIYGGGGVVVLIIIIILWRKRSKRKNGVKIDETL